MKEIPAARRRWGIWVPKSLSVCSLKNTSLHSFLASSIIFTSETLRILLCYQLRAIRPRTSIRTGLMRGAKPPRMRCLRRTRILICLTSSNHATPLPATSASRTSSVVLLYKYRRCTSTIASRRAKICSTNILQPGRGKYPRRLRTCGPISRHSGRHNDDDPKQLLPPLLQNQQILTGCPNPLSPSLLLFQPPPLRLLATSHELLTYPPRKLRSQPLATEQVPTSRRGGRGHPSGGKVGGERRVGRWSRVRRMTGPPHRRQS